MSRLSMHANKLKFIDTLPCHYYKKRSYVRKSNYLANLSWLILHNHSILKGLNFKDTVRTDTLWFILIFTRMCVSVEKSWFCEKLEFRSGNILLLLCGVWPVTSDISPGVSTLHLHSSSAHIPRSSRHQTWWENMTCSKYSWRFYILCMSNTWTDTTDRQGAVQLLMSWWLDHPMFWKE